MIVSSRKRKVPIASSEAVRRSMEANRSRNTGPELKLRRELTAAGLSGYRLHWKDAPGKPDIAYPGKKVAIFVHGCFWHRCPECKPKLPKRNREYWRSKFAANTERDKKNISKLKKEGWTVIIVWECDIPSKLDSIIQRISVIVREN